MAFEKKTWFPRISEFPGRRKLTDVSTGKETVVDVERAEGKVPQEGDAFSAANMNDLEERVYKALSGVSIEYVTHTEYETLSEPRDPTVLYLFLD